MNIDGLSSSEMESMEAEKKARIEEYNDKETVKHYGSVEDLSSGDIESMEAEIKSRHEGYNDKETVKHYGSVEDLTSSEMESIETEIKARRSEIKQTEQHYGSVENLDDAGIRSMEAQVAEKRKQDVPYKEYFNDLTQNPEINDKEEFDAAVIRSMQSNGVMRNFVDSLCEKIAEKAFQLKNIDINDKERIGEIQQEIEKIVAVYEKYLYTLKENEWEFNNLNEMKMPEYIKDNLWQQQKRLDIVFKMPIPKDMGEYYGGSFERNGKMVPGLELMYQDLSGKKVNWHEVMLYKENELTPSQRYKQRLQEDILKKQEILSGKKEELTKLREEKQQGGNSYGE